MNIVFEETPLIGSFLLTPSAHEDRRGSFGRLFDHDLFRQHGLDPGVAQSSFSFNEDCGTLRGMHYQRAEWAEAKLVRCTRGRVFDVIVDLRTSSPTYLNWFGAELDHLSRNAMYVPADFAHGFITLTPQAELHYQISRPYHPNSAAGMRWDDPALAIDWPIEPAVISDRDATFPLLHELPRH